MFVFVLTIIQIISTIICMEAPVVKTTSGYVRGGVVEVNNICIAQYLNIPFAEPPVGRLRFAKPKHLIKPKNGIIDATRTGCSCFQYYTQPNLNPVESEDCLVLNIWAPISANKSIALKPVMFWIYGGGFQWGSIFDLVYNGSALASFDVVIVTANYRLGPFGFLFGGQDDSSGNLGFYDQLLALIWVKNNIRMFGGDPNQITLFGQSAGSYATSAHIVSPLSRGLFKRAILQSASLLQNKDMPYLSPQKALEEARAFAAYFNCSGYKWLDCLRGVDASKIFDYYNLTIVSIYGTEFLPITVQEAFRTKQYSEVDILTGVVKDEGTQLAHTSWPDSDNLSRPLDFSNLVNSLSNRSVIFSNSVKRITTFPFYNLNAAKITQFYLRNVVSNSSEALKRAFQDFYGDILVKCPTYLFAKLMAESTPQRNAFFYHWTYTSQQISSQSLCTQDLGVCHGTDYPYVFGEPFLKNMSDRDFSFNVMKMWTNFAKFGNALGDFSANMIWPRFNNPADPLSGNTKSKEINPFRPNHIIDNLLAKSCDDFWQDYFV